jgi:DnaJ-related protein SCJ1
MANFKSTKFLLFILIVIVTLMQPQVVLCVEEKDYYKILGVQKHANEKEIKKAYKKLSLKWHPDRNRDNFETAREVYYDINEAYETLGDPQKRQVYNRGGVKGVQDHEQKDSQKNVRHDMFGKEISLIKAIYFINSPYQPFTSLC